METATFITQLQQQAQAQQALVQNQFLALNPEALNFKPHATGWSILECLEHLNRYARFYLPHLEKALSAPAAAQVPQTIRYSWMGKKSLELVNPANAKKHKTLKHMNPHNSQLTPAVLQEFLQNQERLLSLLATAPKADLNKKAVPVEFLRLLKMRTGEALEFLVLHQQRHLLQATRVKEQALEPIRLAV
jgi:uncharacterized damage-inducible protein DinB